MLLRGGVVKEAVTFKDRLQGTERRVLTETHFNSLQGAGSVRGTKILTAHPERSTEEIKHHGSVQ